jgi:hypothetical protein
MFANSSITSPFEKGGLRGISKTVCLSKSPLPPFFKRS